MTDKAQAITVIDWIVPGFYEVKVVANSLAFRPGDKLNRGQMLSLINSSDWDVTVISVDLVGAITHIPGIP